MSTPQTQINICSGVRLNSRYEHTIYFEDADAQWSYFAGKTVKVFPAYSYVRNTWPLKVEATMEEAKTWNYLFFQNSPSGKVYYYFINKVEYINDSTVELSLELDVMQTYHFDYTVMNSFVDRAHSGTDYMNENTVEEGLELGELIDNEVTNQELTGSGWAIMIMATINPNGTTATEIKTALPGSYNGVFSGLKFWAVDGERWAEWGNRLDALDEGYAGGIIAMWMYPKEKIVLAGEASWTNLTELCKPVEKAVGIWDYLNDPLYEEYGPPIPVNKMGPAILIDGYKPRNNKLYTYPFNFLYVTNNQGGSAVYRYERFSDNNPGFIPSGALSPDGGVRITPVNYNGAEVNYEAGLALTNFPTCAWDTDVYKMWLAQNQNTHALNMASAQIKVATGGATALIGAFTGGGVGAGLSMAVSGAEQIASHLAQKADRSIEPAQAKGNFSSSINMTDKRQCFTFSRRSVAREYATMIDDYFTMYGYKQNQVMPVLRDARDSFTYIKTVGANVIPGQLYASGWVEKGICNEDITKIAGIYDRGITFWMDGDSIGDYSLPNNPRYVG